MKLLIVAVLLAIAQTTPPGPRKALDEGTGRVQHSQKTTSANTAPTANTPAVAQKPSTKPSSESTQDVGSNNAQAPITVSKLPPVSVEKDWADYIAIGAAILLFGVGAFGIRYAIKTLSTLQRQTTAIEDQTRSLVAQNRAWLVLESIESPHGFQRNTRMRIFSGYGVIWTIKNTGNSPAFIFRIGSRFHRVNNFSELPATPDIEVPDLLMPTRHYKHGFTLGPGQTLERFIMQENPIEHPKTPEDYQAIQKGSPIWLAYGLVEYRTVFDKPDVMRELRFCYRWFAMGEDEFNPCDLPNEYTKQT